MSVTAATIVSRRLALAALATSAAILPRAAGAQALPITLRGMVGGGLARFEASDAQFSIFASRITFNEEDRDVVLGSILWTDSAAGLSFVSTEITDYQLLESPPDQGQTRRIRGVMRVNDGEQAPFLMNISDAGPPGSGLDKVALIVGAGAETTEGATPAKGAFSYAAAGSIVSGDVQDVDFEFGPEGLST